MTVYLAIPGEILVCEPLSSVLLKIQSKLQDSSSNIDDETFAAVAAAAAAVSEKVQSERGEELFFKSIDLMVLRR